MRKEDYHIHTEYLKCADPTMCVPDIVERCAQLGCQTIGISDHINVHKDIPVHDSIKADLKALSPRLDIYFGAELNFLGADQGFPFSEQIKRDNGFQFAIGGVHSSYGAADIAAAAEVNHRHHLLTCRDPLVDVLVHPWWFNSGEFGKDALFYSEDLSFVSDRYIAELAEAALETNTAVEINTSAIFFDQPAYSDTFKNDYKEYLGKLNSAGVTFSIGSDSHNIEHLQQILFAWELVQELAIPEDRMWKPSGEPFVKRAS